MQGAINYELEVVQPSTQSVVFETDKTSRDQYIEAFSMGGTYQWRVTAFGSEGTAICTTEPFTFEKPAYVPSQNNNGGDNDGGNPAPPPPPPPTIGPGT